MRAYLSYRFGDNVLAIKQLLLENNIDIFDSISDIQYGNSLQQTIKNAVKSCDFLVFIYSEDNPHIAFEAGLAVATNKPVFAILAGGNDNTFLLDSTYVHAHPIELNKIKFSFELFLKKISSKKSVRFIGVSSPISQFYGGGDPIPAKSHFDIFERYKTIKGKSGAELEHFFQDVFEAYNVDIVKNSNFNKNNQKWVPDFSIWSDELAPLLSNPIVVEIKSEIDGSNLQLLLDNLNNINSINPANSAIILYDRLNNITERDLPINPNRLFISIATLVSELQSNGFASSIKKIRNSIVHNF